MRGYPQNLSTHDYFDYSPSLLYNPGYAPTNSIVETLSHTDSASCWTNVLTFPKFYSFFLLLFRNSRYLFFSVNNIDSEKQRSLSNQPLLSRVSFPAQTLGEVLGTLSIQRAILNQPYRPATVHVHV